MKAIAVAMTLLVAGCDADVSGSGGQPSAAIVSATAIGADDTQAVQAAVDRGGVVRFAARTYRLTKTITVRHSDTIILGAGPNTLFEFAPAHRDQVHCGTDRVFTTPCDLNDSLPRPLSHSIAIGATAFEAESTAATADVQPGEWIIVTDYDAKIKDRAVVDWAQVSYVDGTTIHVTAPFRTAFGTLRRQVPGALGGLGFVRIPAERLVQHVEFRNFSLRVPDRGNRRDRVVGISVFMAKDVTIDRVSADVVGAPPLYTFMSKGVTVTNSQGRGEYELNEFGVSVDLIICNNVFSVKHGAALGLDLGSAFFDVCGNDLIQSENIGGYLLFGVHDGKFRGNHIAHVASKKSAAGFLSWGSQNVEVSNNILDGGDGPNSVAMSIRGATTEVVIPSVNITLTGNIVGSGWISEYETPPQ